MSFARTNWGSAACGLLTAAVVVWAMIQSHLAETPVAPANHLNAVERYTANQANAATRCANCHQEIVDQMRNAPHWNTLTPGADKQVQQRFVGQVKVDEGESIYEFYLQDGELWCRSNRIPSDRRIDWVMGSGSHAQTPISVQRNSRNQLELIEHRISWYPGQGLGLTLGQSAASSTNPSASRPIGMEFHGGWHKHGAAVACLGCHSWQLDTQQFDSLDHVAGGLGCSRCHFGSDTHAQQQEGQPIAGPRMASWSTLTQRQSVNQCGECHRRADQTPRDEITVEAEHIVRFASVGLVQSKCFWKSESDPELRLDCLTCHDPHRAASRDAAFYSAKCQSCHERPELASCTESPKSKDCVSCHMRRRETQPFLIFTDHWIRR